MDKIINCKEIRNKLLEDYKNKIKSENKNITLVVIQVGNDEASNVYIKNKEKTCKETGINFKHLKYDNIEEEDLIKVIRDLNSDKNITGILVQLPLPNNINKERIINTIDPLKDIDGLTDINQKKLEENKEGLIPCTALGVLEILKYLNIDLKDKNIAIMGRSILVGKPLADILKNKNLKINVVHSKTENKQDITTKADILIVAIGKSNLIDSSYIKEDAIVIDVGINREKDGITGDCNLNDILNKCKYITPVPGGVGQLTTTMLIHNLIKAYDLQKKVK